MDLFLSLLSLSDFVVNVNQKYDPNQHFEIKTLVDPQVNE